MAEMNAERLKVVKDRLERNKKWKSKAFNGWVPSVVGEYKHDDVEWLIEQAERAQELEDVVYGINETYRQEREYNERLSDDNKRLQWISESDLRVTFADLLNIKAVARKALEGKE